MAGLCSPHHVTLPLGWLEETQRVHWSHFIDWLHELFTKYQFKPAELYTELTA
jgi:hypothetical protein